MGGKFGLYYVYFVVIVGEFPEMPEGIGERCP